MANLSNINNNFIVTDVGTGQAVVGATNAVTGSTLTVGGTATFAGDITLGDDLNFTTNGFADISNTGTGAMRFKPSSQTLALTLAGANATFAGNVGIGSAPVGNPATKFLAVGTAGSVAGGIQLWATNAQTHYIQFGDAASGGNYYRGAIGYAHASDTLLLLQSGSTALSFTGSQAATFSGNVGIGGAPSVELQVNASSGYAETRLVGASGSGGTLEFYNDTTKLADIYADPAKNLYFRTDGQTTALTLEADGDGIFRGSVTCDEALQISSTTAQYAYQNFGASAGYGWQIGKAPASGGIVGAQGFYLYNLSDNTVALGVDTSNNATFAGMVDIIGSRSTYVNNAEDDTATSHIFTTDSLVGDFAQLAGSLVLQARVNDAIYRDIILAGGLGTAANPVAPILTVKGEGVVFIDGSFNVSEGSTFANMITINIDDVSTGENRGVRLINTSGVDQQWNITAGVTGEENDSFCIRNSTDNINALKIGRNSTATFAGNVLINKASNPTSLQIGSNLTDDPFIVFQTDGNTMSMGIDRSDSNKFKISENATLGTNDRLCIDGTGNIGIGTSGTNSKLMISDTSNRNFSTAQFKIEGAGYTAVHYLDGTEYMIQQNSGSRRIRMMSGTTNGVLLNPGATAWISGSDIKLKENIKPLKNVLDKIQDYRCVEYNFKNDKDKKIGFIAQDWKNDFPAIIDEDKDGLLGMKYTETIPVLLKAIQELEARIKILEK